MAATKWRYSDGRQPPPLTMNLVFRLFFFLSKILKSKLTFLFPATSACLLPFSVDEFIRKVNAGFGDSRSERGQKPAARKVRVLDCDQIWLIRLYLWFSGDKQILSLNIDPHKIVESVKALLEVEVGSILPVQDVAEIARRAECVVAHLAFSSPSHSLQELKSMVRCMSLSNSSSSLSLSLLRDLLLDSVCCCRSTATGKRPHENFSSGSYEGVGEEEQSLAVRFTTIGFKKLYTPIHVIICSGSSCTVMVFSCRGIVSNAS
ncbi:uncharacterized protein [Pyrus communis]|uniref:uncharacterized protein n=1 Tax=Pyrus communis TaxID=23211 RepID=UPI0035BEBA33